MNIKDKLRLLDKSSPPPYQPVTQAITDVEALAAMLGGEVVENEFGSFILFRHTIPLTRRHGQIELSNFEAITGKTVSILSKKSVTEAFDLANAIYIDTETTGLAGGTGTYVFLIGAGYIKKDAFIIEQLFLPRLADEQAMLEYLNSLTAGRKGIVSFNGKSFDIPLILTRFIANRMNPLIDSHEHLDLLHAARRIWKNDFGNCRLGTLEASLMGFERFEDIPGEEIPYMYMEFLRYGKTERLTPVLSHNKLDIASLLALA
ncbi:MAG: ribonuclease H-like domain-containing protein, partial [bacterium]